MTTCWSLYYHYCAVMIDTCVDRIFITIVDSRPSNIFRSDSIVCYLAYGFVCVQYRVYHWNLYRVVCVMLSCVVMSKISIQTLRLIISGRDSNIRPSNLILTTSVHLCPGIRSLWILEVCPTCTLSHHVRVTCTVVLGLDGIARCCHRDVAKASTTKLTEHVVELEHKLKLNQSD